MTMNSRQKRSSGGYGLRRKVAKKRLDEDFEYYFSKVGPSFETKSGKCDDRTLQDEVFISDLKTNPKVTKSADSSEKRPRGRPRKVQVIPQEPDISESNLKFVDLKEKRCRKPKIIFVDNNDTSKQLEDVGEKMDIISEVACEEEVEDESIDKRLKLDAVLSEEMTELREEEVSSIPEGEKENLPEEGVSLDSYSEDRIIVPIGVEVQYEGGDTEGEVELFDGEDVEKSYSLIQKSKRRYRRNRLSQETIRRLSELSPDDKIECNECHKLLKPSSFRQHLRTHTGEKPFGCEVCEARFTRKGDVERHVRIVHNKQKPYKCCRCQRAFGDKKNLRWHLMNHDKKLFYVCEVCGFKFGKREYWENHVRYIHPLPGGMDPADATADDVDEERLQALTDSLLEDESADEPCHDNESCDGETNENFIGSSVGEPIECRVIKREGLNSIPFKCLPGIVNDTKENELEDSTEMCVENSETSGVEAVVIQINNLSDSCENKKVIPMKVTDKVFPTNIIRVIAPRSSGQFRQESVKHEQPIVIDTQEVVSDENEETSGAQVVQILVPDQLDNDITVGSVDQEPSKIISIVLNEEQSPKLNKSSPLPGVTSFPYNIR